MSIIEYTNTANIPQFFTSEHCHEADVVLPQTELTSPQAAEVICVREEYMDKLLESGEVPSRFVDGVRFVKLKDLMEYNTENIRLRREVLRELAREGQEMGLYD
jgi:hypothetical protein